MEKIIDQVITETETRLNKEIADCERIEAECVKPFPPHDDVAVYVQYVEDRQKGGIYSSKVMSDVIMRKFRLESQLRELANLKFELDRHRR